MMASKAPPMTDAHKSKLPAAGQSARLQCVSEGLALTETRDRRKQRSADAASERAFPAGNVEARTITVSGWTVRQIDPLNWACEHDGRPRMYASDLAEALKLMLRQIAGDHARKDVKGCLQAIRYAEERIVAALK